MGLVAVNRAQVLAFRLQRHHLTARVGVDQLHDVVAVAGLRNTPPGSALTALAARVTGVSGELIDDALARRDVVEVIGPRLSPALVPRDDVGVFTTGAVGLDEASLKLSMGDTPARKMRAAGSTLRAAADQLVEAAHDALADGPLPRGELSAAMTRALPETMTMWCKTCDVRHVHENLMRLPGALGVFCLLPRSGRQVSYVRTDEWLGGRIDPDRTRPELVRRFLRAYAPAGPDGFADWALLSVAAAREVFTAMGDEIETTPDGAVLTEDRDATRAAPTPSGVRLLPPSDPYTLGRDRERLVPDASLRKAVWTSISPPGAVLVEGEIVGTWRAQKKSSTLKLTVSVAGSLPSTARASVDEQAQVVATSRGAKYAEVAYS